MVFRLDEVEQLIGPLRLTYDPTQKEGAQHRVDFTVSFLRMANQFDWPAFADAIGMGGKVIKDEVTID